MLEDIVGWAMPTFFLHFIDNDCSDMIFIEQGKLETPFLAPSTILNRQVLEQYPLDFWHFYIINKALRDNHSLS